MKLGYISNITGKFWLNPTIGAIIHQSLINPNFYSKLSSNFGNTNEPFEPTEFGWFWRKILKLSDMDCLGENIDWSKLNLILKNLKNIFEASIIFDSPYICNDAFMFYKKIDNCKFIYIKRNEWNVCNSILNARMERFGNLDTFYGAKPKNFKSILNLSNPIEQIIKQVYDLKNQIENELKKVKDKDIFTLEIKELRDYPENICYKVQSFFHLEKKKITKKLKTFPDRDKVKFKYKEYEDELNFYFNKYFNKP